MINVVNVWAESPKAIKKVKWANEQATSTLDKAPQNNASPSNSVYKHGQSHTKNGDAANGHDQNMQDCLVERVVFLNAESFYACWRLLSSNVLFDAMLILPHFHSQWIIDGAPHSDETIAANIDNMLDDSVFCKLLQWKYEQGLVFCMHNSPQTVFSWDLKSSKIIAGRRVTPFWQHVSEKLAALTDPSTFKTSKYKELIFDSAFYASPKFESKYNVKSSDIVQELCTQKTKCVNVICEILYQSNPSLNVIVSVDELTGNDMAGNVSQDWLDELSMKSLGKSLKSCKSGNKDKSVTALIPDDLSDIFKEVQLQWDAETTTVDADEEDKGETLKPAESSVGEELEEKALAAVQDALVDILSQPDAENDAEHVYTLSTDKCCDRTSSADETDESFIGKALRSIAIHSDCPSADAVAVMLQKPKPIKAKDCNKEQMLLSPPGWRTSAACEAPDSPESPEVDPYALLEMDGWWVADEYYDYDDYDEDED